MAVTREKFSIRQAGYNVAVDVLAMSPQARANTLPVPMTNGGLAVVQNTTKIVSVPVTHDLKVLNGYVAYVTIPAQSGGTTTIQVDYVAVDGTTTTNIVAAQTLLGLTNKVPVALTMAATNPASCVAGGQLLFTVACSNNAVGTADVGGTLVLGYERVEATVISDSNVNTANS